MRSIWIFARRQYQTTSEGQLSETILHFNAGPPARHALAAHAHVHLF